MSKRPKYGHVRQELRLLVTVSIISQWSFRVNTGTRARESEMREEPEQSRLLRRSLWDTDPRLYL